MADKFNKILKAIEELREELYHLMKQQGSFSPKVVEKSQELDQLLNEYQRLVKESDSHKKE